MQVKEVKISDCRASKNSRMIINDQELANLMQSIKENGLLQPIGVMPKGKKWEVAYGNRRLAAYKKLGRKTIPAVIKSMPEKASDIDLINLSENLQRANLSLDEVGRYLDMLAEDGMTKKEIAARLGVTNNFVGDALQAFHRVPEDMRKDVVASPKGKVKPGKMSISTARMIESVRRKYGLTRPQTKKLYSSAKAKGFTFNRVDEYALAIINDRKLKGEQAVEQVNAEKKRVQVAMYFSEDDYNKLWNKHIVEGPYSTMPEVCRAIFNREARTGVKCKPC